MWIFSTNGDRSQFKIVCVKVKRFAHFSLPKRHCRTVCLRYALELLLLLLLFKSFGYLPFQFLTIQWIHVAFDFIDQNELHAIFICDAFVFIHNISFSFTQFFLRKFCESFSCLENKVKKIVTHAKIIRNDLI